MKLDLKKLLSKPTARRRNAAPMRMDNAVQEIEVRFGTLFDTAPFGIAVADMETGYPVKANPAMQEMLGYTEAELLQLHFSEFTHPNDVLIEWPLYKGLVEGARPHYQIEKRYLCKGGQIIWVRLNVSTILDKENRPFAIAIIENISERKQTEERLHKEMIDNARHTRELEAIIDISTAIRQADNRGEMMSALLDKTLATLGAQAGALGELNGNSLIIAEALGMVEQWKGKVIPQAHNHFWEVIRSGEPRFVDTPVNPVAAGFLAPLESLATRIQAGVFIPLKREASTIGVLFAGFSQPTRISDAQKRLAGVIADMAGSKLHRMSIADSLERMVAERTRELQTIYEVMEIASRPLELEQALQAALNPILEAADAQVGVILLLDEAEDRFRVLANTGLSEAIRREIESANQDDSIETWVVTHQQPYLAADLAADPRVDPAGKPQGNIRFAALPMRVGDHTVGILEIARLGGSQFDVDELVLFSFMADHLGLVVEHVRLFEQQERNAVREERSRLARELHDSITQSLYSATLLSDGGRRLAEQGRYDEVRECLAQLGAVSQEALKEMRLMVFQLRSPALRSAGLASALQHRLDTVENRLGIHTDLEVNNLSNLNELLEDALYRITLEALNNALRHARASQVQISLNDSGKGILLIVADNGQGFDGDEAAQSGGFGLTSMRERAERLNGSLNIQSTPGTGTKVIVQLPLPTNGVKKHKHIQDEV